MLNQKRTGLTKAKIRSTLVNLSQGLETNTATFESRIKFDFAYGYNEKNIALKGILDDFWMIVGK